MSPTSRRGFLAAAVAALAAPFVGVSKAAEWPRFPGNVRLIGVWRGRIYVTTAAAEPWSGWRNYEYVSVESREDIYEAMVKAAASFEWMPPLPGPA